MNLINSVNYSDLKSQTNVIKIISELYNEDMSINPKEDFKEQILSNIQRKLNNNLPVKVLFTIFVHELEINEASSEFDKIKNSIWDILKKDQTVETFDCFIRHISCLYNKYDSILMENIICKDNNIYEYINNFKDPSLIEDKILEAIPLNHNTMLFYVDFLEYLNCDVGKFINLFSALDFQDDINLERIDDDKNISLISMVFLLKQACLSYYSTNIDKIKNLKFDDKYLNYILLKYINNYKLFDLEDLEQLHYFKSYFICCFIKREILAIYKTKDIQLLLNTNNLHEDIRKDFFAKFNKIKNIIKTSNNNDFHKSIFDFLFDNLPINFSMLFVTSQMVDYFDTVFLDKIKNNRNNIDDFKIKMDEVSSSIFKNESNKIIDFLLSGDTDIKLKQYLSYQEPPFNYSILVSEFINIYKQQSQYIKIDLDTTENIFKDNASNSSEEKIDSKKEHPSLISEYSNYKIGNFIQSVYINNSEQSERNKKIGDFSSKLNMRQFQYCINSLILYHKNNNLTLNIDDKKSITFDILNTLSENNIQNLDEYRTILINSMHEKSSIDIEFKNNSDHEYITHDDDEEGISFKIDEDEITPSFEEDNEYYTEDEIKKRKEIDEMIISIYENDKLNTEDKAIFFAQSIKYFDVQLFKYAIKSLRKYHLDHHILFSIEEKKKISNIIIDEIIDVIDIDKEYEDYTRALAYAISGCKEEVKNKNDEGTMSFLEDDTHIDNDELKPVDENDSSYVMEIICNLQEEIEDNNNDEKNYAKEKEPKECVVSDEPLYEIFSAESEIEIQSYAEDLGDEGKGVKNQLRRIRKTGNKRYLQSSSKFFEKVNKLRHNFPNFEEVITAIEDYSILNQLGDNHFYIPPSLLVGDPGIGKTFFLSELSDTIGIENKIIHMETISASWLLVGASSQWKDSKPGVIFENIIKSKYANNIFILDELDKTMKSSNYPVDNCLLQIFEHHTAKEFQDEYMPLKLDISKIIWLATANTLSTISDPILSRLQTYKIANPNFNERKKLAQNIYNHMLAENTWGSHFNPIIPDATLDKLCEPSDSIREMKKVLLKAITHSARRNDNVITIEDIISVNTTSKNKIGFM